MKQAVKDLRDIYGQEEVDSEEEEQGLPEDSEGEDYQDQQYDSVLARKFKARMPS